MPKKLWLIVAIGFLVWWFQARKRFAAGVVPEPRKRDGFIISEDVLHTWNNSSFENFRSSGNIIQACVVSPGKNAYAFSNSFFVNEGASINVWCNIGTSVGRAKLSLFNSNDYSKIIGQWILQPGVNDFILTSPAGVEYDLILSNEENTELNLMGEFRVRITQ